MRRPARVGVFIAPNSKKRRRCPPRGIWDKHRLSAWTSRSNPFSGPLDWYQDGAGDLPTASPRSGSCAVPARREPCVGTVQQAPTWNVHWLSSRLKRPAVCPSLPMPRRERSKTGRLANDFPELAGIGSAGGVASAGRPEVKDRRLYPRARGRPRPEYRGDHLSVAEVAVGRHFPLVADPEVDEDVLACGSEGGGGRERPIQRFRGFPARKIRMKIRLPSRNGFFHFPQKSQNKAFYPISLIVET